LRTVTRTEVTREKSSQQRIRHGAGSRFDQPVALRHESTARRLHDGRIGHGVDELVGVRRIPEVDRQFEIENKPLADLGFVLHHAVMGMD